VSAPSGNRTGTEYLEKTNGGRRVRPFVTVLSLLSFLLLLINLITFTMVSLVVLIKFANKPTITYKTLRTHRLPNKLRLHR
jgi:hypothetical protein